VEARFNHIDILVGGGTADAIAAIQAGRAGLETAIVEMNGQLGCTVALGLRNACFQRADAPNARCTHQLGETS